MEPSEVVGLTIKEWCRQAGIGYSTFYVLPLALRPRRAKIGKREIVYEPAEAWLKRMARRRNGVQTTRQAAA
jgi:hypothetical protein